MFFCNLHNVYILVQTLRKTVFGISKSSTNINPSLKFVTAYFKKPSKILRHILQGIQVADTSMNLCFYKNYVNLIELIVPYTIYVNLMMVLYEAAIRA
jgi:hypothetical protein